MICGVAESVYPVKITTPLVEATMFQVSQYFADSKTTELITLGHLQRLLVPTETQNKKHGKKVRVQRLR